MAGRILSGDAYERYVELSHEYDVFSWSPTLNQTVAAFNGETVILHKLSNEEGLHFELSFEEMNALVEAYQAYLADAEVRQNASVSDFDDLDDHPF